MKKTSLPKHTTVVLVTIAALLLVILVAVRTPQVISGRARPRTSSGKTRAAVTLNQPQDHFRPMTLRQVRQQFLNQQVIVHDPRGPVHPLPYVYFNTWRRYKRIGNHYEDPVGFDAELPSKYSDKLATIMAIQTWHTGGQTNAVGKTLSEDDVYGGFDVVVRFNDGTVAGLGISLNELTNENFHTWEWDRPLTVVPMRDEHERLLSKRLPDIAGKKLYAVSDSSLFSYRTTEDEMLRERERDRRRLEDVPLLTPLTIAGSKYNRMYDIVILDLIFPTGEHGLTATHYRDDIGDVDGDGFLSRIAGDLLTEIPHGLTDREIAAIRERQIFKGMRKEAVYLAWGHPSRKNVWSSSGGSQLVFRDSYFVYVNESGEVTDWQFTQ